MPKKGLQNKNYTGTTTNTASCGVVVGGVKVEPKGVATAVERLFNGIIIVGVAER